MRLYIKKRLFFRPVSDYFVTRPLPPCALTTDELSPTSCHLKWKAPDKNSCIRGFQIKVASVPDKKVVWERSVMKHVKQFVVEGLAPGTDYDVSFTRSVRFKINRYFLFLFLW